MSDERERAPRRRLIVCDYPDRGETLLDVSAFLEGEGYRVVGSAAMETVDVAWTDRGPE